MRADRGRSPVPPGTVGRRHRHHPNRTVRTRPRRARRIPAARAAHPRWPGDTRMIALLRTYLAPYKAALSLVVALLVVQAVATLYLPALNGDIINHAVAKGHPTY